MTVTFERKMCLKKNTQTYCSIKKIYTFIGIILRFYKKPNPSFLTPTINRGFF